MTGERIQIPPKVGHHQSASEAPFKWCFGGGSMMAEHWMLAWKFCDFHSWPVLLRNPITVWFYRGPDPCPLPPALLRIRACLELSRIDLILKSNAPAHEILYLSHLRANLSTKTKYKTSSHAEFARTSINRKYLCVCVINENLPQNLSFFSIPYQSMYIVYSKKHLQKCVHGTRMPPPPPYCQIRINKELSLTKGNNSLRPEAIWAILKLEHILVLKVTKFHRTIIKTIHVREQTSFQPMIFHKLRAITP